MHINVNLLKDSCNWCVWLIVGYVHHSSYDFRKLVRCHRHRISFILVVCLYIRTYVENKIIKLICTYVDYVGLPMQRSDERRATSAERRATSDEVSNRRGQTNGLMKTEKKKNSTINHSGPPVCSLDRSISRPVARTTAWATARATARATERLIDRSIDQTNNQANYLQIICLMNGYQWWYNSSLIAIDKLTAYVVNLSAVAGASNMHAMPALHTNR